MERRKMLSSAEADRIRVTSIADVNACGTRSAVLKQNPRQVIQQNRRGKTVG